MALRRCTQLFDDIHEMSHTLTRGSLSEQLVMSEVIASGAYGTVYKGGCGAGAVRVRCGCGTGWCGELAGVLVAERPACLAGLGVLGWWLAAASA